MFNSNAFKTTVLATVTAMSLGGHAASAQPTFITRGPHGAVSIVDKVPLGATLLPTTPSRGYPTIMTRGSHGAAHIVSGTKAMKAMKTMSQSTVGFPKLVTVGPHGAVRLVN